MDPVRDYTYALETLEKIESRSQVGIENYHKGRALGVTGITALRECHTMARDALFRLREEGAA